MTNGLEIGRAHEIQRVVTPDLTAKYYGNPGVNVFATPAAIALLEETSVSAVAPVLAPGQASVGTKVDVRHLAATPVGMTVVGRAELVEIDGRRLVFKVEARDERDLIMIGTHERFVVELDKFLSRADGKRQAPI